MLFHHLTQFLGQVPVLPPPSQPVTPELSNEIICIEQVDAAFLPPAVLDAISKVSEFTENLRKLRFVIYAGAPLSTEVGDLLRDKTRLINSYGQTETGLLHQYRTDDDDYAYVNFGDLSNIQLQHQSGDLYEAVMVRKEGLEIYQAGFITDPEINEIRTRDLFSRHPDPAKSDLWIHRGRVDDVIVFETGEKMNPSSMEGLISSHQKVKSAIVIGEGRFQSALLIEPVNDVESLEERAALLESVWPIIEDANRDCPAHGRVMKSHVLLTQPRLPFVRTSKSNINRTATIELYKDAINQVYNAANGFVDDAKIVVDIMNSKEGLLAQVRELLRKTTTLDISNDDDNFYQLGMDSLQTLQLSRNLKTSLRKAKLKLDILTPSFVYSHPTLRQLSEGLSNLSQSRPIAVDKTLQFKEMKTRLSEYLKVLPAKKEKSKCTSPSSMVVLLTGSTGSFGSYLLHSLLLQKSVSHVYCLNRSADASSLQVSGNAARGLISTFDPSRVTFYTCNFSKPLLGLDQAIYDRLLNQITHIIHNAWTVNFNLSLSTFASTNIVGLGTLIQFCAESTNRIQIFFVSSIGTVVNWRQAGYQGAVPEEIIDDPETAEHQGYAQSKWISEHLLYTAHKRSGIDVCCLRVGQIAGPVGMIKGAWNNKEWFPLFLTSCKSLGMIPNALPLSNSIDWIPVDILADVVVELVQRGVHDQGSQVYNLVNPSTSTWEDLNSVVHRGLAGTDGKQMKLVDYPEWVRGLENVASENITEKDIRDNPAVKLLEFFQAVEVNKSTGEGLTISTDKATQHSSILRACGPVTAEWMSLWVAQLGLTV
jgi:thioester reductase-like protein